MSPKLNSTFKRLGPLRERAPAPVDYRNPAASDEHRMASAANGACRYPPKTERRHGVCVGRPIGERAVERRQRIPGICLMFACMARRRGVRYSYRLAFFGNLRSETFRPETQAGPCHPTEQVVNRRPPADPHQVIPEAVRTIPSFVVFPPPRSLFGHQQWSPDRVDCQQVLFFSRHNRTSNRGAHHE